ncbi:MAG: protein-L-isoaspartate O-methyltransferase [Nitrososphaerales archaeon]
MKNGSHDLTAAREYLISELKREKILKSGLIEEALRAIPRETFVWSSSELSLAYEDQPIPLGDTGQTISAPHMVVKMLEELEIIPSIKILEVGGGSGYNATLMGYMASKGVNVSDPLVVTVERDPRLVSFAMKNVTDVGLDRIVQVVGGDGSLGYPQESTEEIYDRIIVTAGAPHVPSFLKRQLRQGGIMVIPVGQVGMQVLRKLRKVSAEEFIQQELMECMFVPLVGSDAHYF